jgi:hypothetical protein
MAQTLGRIDSEGARVLAVVLEARSRGLDDLRGEEDPGAQPVGGPSVRHHFIGATVAGPADGIVGRIVGDFLVPTTSATGRRSRVPEDPVPSHAQTVLEGLHHLDLVSHPRVYAQLRSALGASSDPSPPSTDEDP